jgi:Sec-independent protein translocase protein TatA
MSAMLALFGNLDFTEIIVIAAVALMIFGRRLPEMAVRVASQVVKIRRSVSQVWRDAGIEEEIRKVKRNIEQDMPRIADPAAMTRKMVTDIERQLDEPAGEQERAADGSGAELVEVSEAEEALDPGEALLDEPDEHERHAAADEPSDPDPGADLDQPGDRESA